MRTLLDTLIDMLMLIAMLAIGGLFIYGAYALGEWFFVFGRTAGIVLNVSCQVVLLALVAWLAKR